MKNVPESTLKKFNKVLFKTGDAVCFTWFGERCYGFIVRSKRNTWGTQYTVEMDGIKYPCGIQIDGYKTKYATGCVLYEDTKNTDAEELKRKASIKPEIYNSITIKRTLYEQSGSEQPRQISTNSRRKKGKSTGNDGLRRTDVDTTDTETASNSAIGVSGTTNIGTGDTRMRRRNSKESSNTKPKKEIKKKENKDLEDAIKKQKDFLSGFVKKE